MNKPLHYALVGGLVLFIGLYIPFHILGDQRGSSAFTKATDYSFITKSNPNATFSSSFRSVASDSYFTSGISNAHFQSTTWSNSHTSMAMPLNFNTFEWTPSASKPFVEQAISSYSIQNFNQNQPAATHLAHHAVSYTPQRSEAQNSAASASVQAKTQAVMSMQAPRYLAHQSVVQQPFSNALPSEINTSFAGSTPDGISNRKNGFITPEDPGEQSPESPVGEPWIMLIFAVIATATITLRKRLQKAQA